MIWMRTQAWLGLGEACPRVSRPGPSLPWERRHRHWQGSEGWVSPWSAGIRARIFRVAPEAHRRYGCMPKHGWA